MYCLRQTLDQINKHHEFLKQQSIVLWLQKEDRNTKYFYAKMSMRRHRNKIHALLDSQGNYIYDSDSIRKESIAYYQ